MVTGVTLDGVENRFGTRLPPLVLDREIRPTDRLTADSRLATIELQ
jgi:hypothetical protein